MNMKLAAIVPLLCVLCCEQVYNKVIKYGEQDKPIWNRLPPVFYDTFKDELEKVPADYEVSYNNRAFEDDVPARLREVYNWPSAAAKALIGQVGGLAMDRAGNVVVFHRADRQWLPTSFGMFNRFNPALGPINADVILTIKPSTGDVVSHFGTGEYYMPHGLTIDHEGNMWLTDVGLHQVFKISKGSTSPSLTLGVRLEPGSDDIHFCKPTDVAVASNGEFFVADGYCNGRIMKFSPDGTLLHQWGHRSTGSLHPDPDEFHIPHSLALDEGRGLICVADRENGRIQCFDAGINGSTTGTFRKGFEPGRGTIYAVEYDPIADVMYAVNGPGVGIIEGLTLDMNGNILETWGPVNKEFGQPHDVTVSFAGMDVYVGDIGEPSKVWRLSRQTPGSNVLGK